MIRVTCPICGKVLQATDATEWPEFPFCSPRCRTIDLGRWLGESYRVPTADSDRTEESIDEDEAP